MKKIFAVLLAGIVAASMVACTQTRAEIKNVIIKTQTSFGGSDASAEAYEMMLANFMTANKKITVKDSSINADDSWKSMVRSQFEDGSEPDVLFFFTGADATSIIESNKVVSLDEIRKQYPEYAKNVKESAFASVRESDGKIYAVPVKGFYEGLFCNTALFQKYNVPEITDWNSLLFAIDTFRKNGVTPIAASFQDIPNYLIEHSILSAGGTAAHSVIPTSPEEVPQGWIDGMNELKELYARGAFQSDCLVTQHQLAQQKFNNGEAAMILEGSWFGLSSTVANDVSLTAFPSKTESAEKKSIIAGFSMGFYISRKAWDNEQKRDACVKYVEFMTSNSSIAQFCESGGAPAADVTSSEKANPFALKGIEYSKKYNFEMPIDSKLKKSAWEYLLGNTVEVVKGRLAPEKLFENALKQ